MRSGAFSALTAVLLAASALSGAGAQEGQPAGKPPWTDPPAKSAAPVRPDPAKAAPTAGPATPIAERATSRKTARSSARRTSGRREAEAPVPHADTRTKAATETKGAPETKGARAGRPVTSRPAEERSDDRQAARTERPGSRSVGRLPTRRAPRVTAYRYGEPETPSADPGFRGSRGFAPEDPRWVRVRMPPPGRVLVQGRVVQFPDGRTLRVYRPRGDEDEVD